MCFLVKCVLWKSSPHKDDVSSNIWNCQWAASGHVEDLLRHGSGVVCLSVTWHINTNTPTIPLYPTNTQCHTYKPLIHNITSQNPTPDRKPSTWPESKRALTRLFLSGLRFVYPLRPLVLLSDSTVHCVSERHPISMTTIKDRMIPPQTKLNFNFSFICSWQQKLSLTHTRARADRIRAAPREPEPDISTGYKLNTPIQTEYKPGMAEH